MINYVNILHIKYVIKHDRYIYKIGHSQVGGIYFSEEIGNTNGETKIPFDKINQKTLRNISHKLYLWKCDYGVLKKHYSLVKIKNH